MIQAHLNHNKQMGAAHYGHQLLLLLLLLGGSTWTRLCSSDVLCGFADFLKGLAHQGHLWAYPFCPVIRCLTTVCACLCGVGWSFTYMISSDFPVYP